MLETPLELRIIGLNYYFAKSYPLTVIIENKNGSERHLEIVERYEFCYDVQTQSHTFICNVNSTTSNKKYITSVQLVFGEWFVQSPNFRHYSKKPACAKRKVDEMEVIASS